MERTVPLGSQESLRLQGAGHRKMVSTALQFLRDEDMDKEVLVLLLQAYSSCHLQPSGCLGHEL